MERAAQHGEVLEIERADIEVDDGARNRPGRDVSALLGQHVEQHREAGSGDHVGHDVDRVGAEFGEQVGVAIEKLIGAEVGDIGPLGFGSHGDHMGASALGELNGC